MKKLRLILLSAVLVAVFGFSFIGCSNDSSNGGSSNHDMTIQLEDESGTTYTYYADYAADDNFARKALPKMIVFNSDGTKIEDDSVSITHEGNYTYVLSFDDGTGKQVGFLTNTEEFDSYVEYAYRSQNIVKLSINGRAYTYTSHVS